MNKRRVGICLASIGLTVVAACGCGGKQEKPVSESVTPTRAATARASRVILEIDQMEGTPAVPESAPGGPAEASLKKIYHDAGIDVDVRVDQTNLPRAEKVRLADLHNLMTSFDTIQPPPGVGKVHALVVTAEDEEPTTLGIMFDFDSQDVNSTPREGFAVFATAHQALNNVPAELLLTTAHEMAHCFNLHHADWEGTGFQDHSTIEGYSMTDTVRWALSDRSADHIRHHVINEVWPGKGGLPFGSIAKMHLDHHETDPAESYSVFDTAPAARGVAGGRAPLKALARERVALREMESDPVRLVLEAPKPSYIVGEPVVLTVGIHNTGSSGRYVLPLLDPRYQFLNVEYRKKDGGEFQAFRSAVLADARGVTAARLQPGESRHEEIKVFFGAKGWTFKDPGTYEVRADFPADAATPDVLRRAEGRIQSPVIELQIQAPATEPDRRASRKLLGYKEGLFLFLDGASHLKGAKETLQSVVQEDRNSVVAPAARLALAQAALHPAPEPGSRVVPGADVAKAKEYLEGLPTATLPTEAVVRATRELSVEVQKRGDTQEAQRLRTNARRIEQQEVVRDKERIRRVITRVGP